MSKSSINKFNSASEAPKGGILRRIRNAFVHNYRGLIFAGALSALAPGCGEEGKADTWYGITFDARGLENCAEGTTLRMTATQVIPDPQKESDIRSASCVIEQDKKDGGAETDGGADGGSGPAGQSCSLDETSGLVAGRDAAFAAELSEGSGCEVSVQPGSAPVPDGQNLRVDVPVTHISGQVDNLPEAIENNGEVSFGAMDTDGNPLDGVTITEVNVDTDTPRACTTGSNGACVIGELPLNTGLRFIASKPGFKSTEVTITLHNGRPRIVSIRLERLPEAGECTWDTNGFVVKEGETVDITGLPPTCDDGKPTCTSGDPAILEVTGGCSVMTGVSAGCTTVTATFPSETDGGTTDGGTGQTVEKPVRVTGADGNPETCPESGE